MKIPVWTELVCRTCSNASPEGRFTSDGKVDIKGLQEVAASRGWQFKHNECFCSSRCLKKFEEQDGKV